MTLPHRFEAARPPWQPGGALSGPCVLVFPSSFRRKFSQNHQGDGELRPLGVFVKGSIQAVPLVSDPGCPERFRAELKINAHGPKPPRSQSRERSGPQARGSERSRAVGSGPTPRAGAGFFSDRRLAPQYVADPGFGAETDAMARSGRISAAAHGSNWLAGGEGNRAGRNSRRSTAKGNRRKDNGGDDGARTRDLRRDRPAF